METSAEILELLKPSNFFQNFSDQRNKDLFLGVERVWEGLDRLHGVLDAYFLSNPQVNELPQNFQVRKWQNREGYEETLLYVKEAFFVEQDMVFPEYKLALGQGTTLEPSALIKPPLVVGKKTEIRQGAYIRGGAWIGNHCTVGHCTEVKTAIFMDHTEAGHFAYVGDSILGRCVNLGAGTKLANLPFRTHAQKENQSFEPFDLKVMGHAVQTGKAKLGAILADGVETGCNSTLAPGVLIGKDSWIYPCVFVRGGYYPAKSLVKTDSKIQRIIRK